MEEVYSRKKNGAPASIKQSAIMTFLKNLNHDILTCLQHIQIFYVIIAVYAAPAEKAEARPDHRYGGLLHEKIDCLRGAGVARALS